MRTAPKRDRAVTVPEVVLLTALIALLLLITAGLYDHYLNRAKVRQVSALLENLAQAAEVYHEATGAYPRGRGDGACDPILAGMQTIPAPAAVLHENASNLLYLSDGKLRCLDPWGRPLRYLSAQSQLPEHQRRVAANGGVPIFESAGPDRDFGDQDSVRQADNIRSDDPTSTPA